jgi:hypothetical protein
VARTVTIRVFQDAVEALADDPSDPLANVLDDLAEQIRAKALENARKIVPTLPDNFLSVEAGKDTKGIFFRVEPDGVGRLSAYLTWKEFREHAWFEPALQEVLGAGALRTPGGRGVRNFFNIFK